MGIVADITGCTFVGQVLFMYIFRATVEHGIAIVAFVAESKIRCALSGRVSGAVLAFQQGWVDRTVGARRTSTCGAGAGVVVMAVAATDGAAGG